MSRHVPQVISQAMKNQQDHARIRRQVLRQSKPDNSYSAAGVKGVLQAARIYANETSQERNRSTTNSQMRNQFARRKNGYQSYSLKTLERVGARPQNNEYMFWVDLLLI